MINTLSGLMEKSERARTDESCKQREESSQIQKKTAEFKNTNRNEECL